MIIFDYGEYFTRKELQCSYTSDCDMDQDFMILLNSLRSKFDKPIVINSGYRSPDHPVEKVKPNGPGAHTSGKAVDIGVRGADALKIIELSLELGFTGIGVNQKGSGRFIHLDTLKHHPHRPRPHIWSY